jgi:dihydrolipoamide dehydrogenase
VIGGGVIGVEMASVYNRLGTQVTVIEYMDNICPFLDADIAD